MVVLQNTITQIETTEFQNYEPTSIEFVSLIRKTHTAVHFHVNLSKNVFLFIHCDNYRYFHRIQKSQVSVYPEIFKVLTRCY